ncbi:hypothetical protein SAMN05444581_10951 [Methylocapsa palsarum]|uniref:Uncharacterized protein n=1 Tax=Methylocapsa palsarum TaxID=1612308 RepID=A0A1I4A2N7_9HYPH|nr:hypothetical protein SAMN05444581_10951 [Methylocapsa palsarum]
MFTGLRGPPKEGARASGVLKSSLILYFRYVLMRSAFTLAPYGQFGGQSQTLTLAEFQVDR